MTRFGILATLALAPCLVIAGCLSDDDVQPGEDDGGLVDGGGPKPFDATMPDHAAPNGDDGGDTDATVDAHDGGIDAAIDAHDAAFADAGTATVRLANMVPNFASAIDVCVTAPSGKLLGPVLLAGGVAGGLAYGEMTDYVGVPIGTQATIRVVAAGSINCNTPLIPDIAGLGGADGEKATVVLMGSTANGAAHPPSLAVFLDGAPTAPPSGHNVRFIHAAPLSGAADFLLGAGAFNETLQPGLTYGTALTPGGDAGSSYPQDVAGYVALDMSEALVTAHLGGADVAAFHMFAGVKATNVTAFFTGLEGSGATPPALVSCYETPAPASHKVDCTIDTAPPALVPMRLVNLSPDFPAADFCVTLWNGTKQSAPILAAAGVAGGLPFLRMTGVIAAAPPWQLMDLKGVTPGAGCGGSRISGGSVAFEGNADTVALASGYAFPDGGAGSLGLATDTASTGAAVVDGGAAVSVGVWDFDTVYLTDAGNNYDLLETMNDGGVETAILQNVPPLAGAFPRTLAPGTRTMRFARTGGGATIDSKTNVTFADGERALFWLFHDAYQHPQTIRCDVAPPDAGSLTTCSE